MEAIASYDYQATQKDELSFRKNECIKVVDFNTQENNGWFRAECKGVEGLVPSTYIEMKPYEWFQEISRKQAEALLTDSSKAVGSYIVRHSENHQAFSITVKSGPNKSDHWRIMRDGTGKYFVWVMKFDSLNALVDYYKTTSICKNNTVLLSDGKSATISRQESANKNRVSAPRKSANIKVKALYNFSPGDTEELELREGDIITVTDSSDPDWWHGYIVRGGLKQEGHFPKSYVETY